MIYERVKEYCKDNSISVSALEKKCGIGNGTIRLWEKSAPSLTTLLKLEKGTGVSIAEWVKGIDNERH